MASHHLDREEGVEQEFCVGLGMGQGGIGFVHVKSWEEMICACGRSRVSAGQVREKG